MAVRESAIPQQGVGGPVTAQDINGKDCVQAQKKSRGKGEPAGDGGDDLSHKRLDPVNQQKTQPAPEKGEEKAHPPMDLKGEMGVVPEGNMQKYFVKEAHQIFSGGGRKGGPQSQQDDMPRQKRGGGQNKKGAQAVDRAERKKIETFSVPLGVVGDAGKGHFQQKAQKTSVYKGYKQDKIEMRGDRAEMSDFPLYLNTVAGGLDCRDQTIGGFSFVVKIYALPVVEIIG